MRLGREISVALGAFLVLTACSGGSASDVVPPTRPSSAPSFSLPPLPSASPLPSSSRAPSPTEEAAPDLSTFYDQDVTWHNCGNADCAKITVPLDYSQPEGATIELTAARVKATGEKIGTLFVDPGGPGGSAVDYARAADRIVSKGVLEHYDVVGVDPRGVGSSEPIHCLTDKQTDEILAVDGTPDSPQEEQATIDASAVVEHGCEKFGGSVYQHMGTVDAARDLDIARAAVDDDTFSYLGKSYGTMLGATYAELFPDRVGRMVLDGALPANLNLVEVTKGQADEFEIALRHFVDDCLGSKGCPLSGTTDEGVKQVQDWLTSLDSAPLTSNGRQLNEPLATYAVLSYLYFPANDYPALRSALSSAMTDKDARPLLSLLDARIDRGLDGHYVSNGTDAFYGVTCLDRPFTGTVNDVKKYAEEWKATAPTFGPSLAWGLLPCKDWPVVGDPVPDTTAKGSNPILVVSSTHDPATPYQWGVDLAATLENGHLLTNDGWGHTAYRANGNCIAKAVDAYLLSGAVPEDGTVCS
jgi:pimeloyl-ACP methyl ester carboxylesterase